MGIAQYFHRGSSASASQPSSRSSLFWPLFASNFVLSALSISNLGLISSMVGFLLDQKHNVHSYRIDFPGAPFDLNVEPKNLWVDQGHTSNGVAGYGFFLGLFGMLVAWRVRKSMVSRTSHQQMYTSSLHPKASVQAPHGPPHPTASRHTLHPQRLHLRLRRNISNNRPTHPPTHRSQHPRRKLPRVQMDAGNVVQGRA
jgi:hypothetical protein